MGGIAERFCKGHAKLQEDDGDACAMSRLPPIEAHTLLVRLPMRVSDDLRWTVAPWVRSASDSSCTDPISKLTRHLVLTWLVPPCNTIADVTHARTLNPRQVLLVLAELCTM